MTCRASGILGTAEASTLRCNGTRPSTTTPCNVGTLGTIRHFRTRRAPTNEDRSCTRTVQVWLECSYDSLPTARAPSCDCAVVDWARRLINKTNINMHIFVFFSLVFPDVKNGIAPFDAKNVTRPK